MVEQLTTDTSIYSNLAGLHSFFRDKCTEEERAIFFDQTLPGIVHLALQVQVCMIQFIIMGIEPLL